MLNRIFRAEMIMVEMVLKPWLWFMDQPSSFNTAALYGQDCRSFMVVHTQINCGSCMALASSTAYGMRGCKLGLNRVPSPYQIMDCSRSSCDKGMAPSDLVAVLMKGVPDIIATPNAYAWGCSLAHPLYQISGYNHVCSVRAIKRELMTGGPLVYSVQFSEGFANHQRGIYRDDGLQIDYNNSHAMVVTGWVDATGDDPGYWTVWNSWSREWGEQGQARIDMYHTDCMIALHVLV